MRNSETTKCECYVSPINLNVYRNEVFYQERLESVTLLFWGATIRLHHVHSLAYIYCLYQSYPNHDVTMSVTSIVNRELILFVSPCYLLKKLISGFRDARNERR
jgi:hypothetical protein